MVIATAIFIDAGCPSELSREHDHGVIEFPHTLQVREQGSHGPVQNFALVRRQLEHALMHIPALIAHLHGTDIVFDKTPGQQTSLTEGSRSITRAGR